MNKRQTTQEFWNDNWKRAGKGLGTGNKDNYFWRRMDASFRFAFSDLPSDPKLIELGVGASEWLPRFAKLYGMNVAGLDYSQPGCQRAREILQASDVEGDIVHADMFDPPNELISEFDVVCSFGLIEHFTDTAATVSACSRFGKPGSIVFTLIPNMTGLNGFLYKTLNRPLYDTHVPLTLDALRKGHEGAGLEILRTEHVLGLPGIMDSDRREPILWRRILRSFASGFRAFNWWLEERGIGVPENALTSPYMICIAKKPLESEKA